MIGPYNNAFLLGLPDAVGARLGPLLEPVNVPAGTDLYRPGAPLDWVYFPVAGLISLSSLLESADQIDAEVIGREGVLGLMEAAGSGRMPSRALVRIALSAARLPVARYVELLDEDEAFRRAVFLHAEVMLAETREALACRTHHRVQARLASWLITYQAQAGYETLYLSQEFLAAILGVQRTTINAAATDLKTSGLIKYARGKIRIGNRAGLERVACQCHAVRADHRRRVDQWASARARGNVPTDLEGADWPAGLSRRHASASGVDIREPVSGGR